MRTSSAAPSGQIARAFELVNSRRYEEAEFLCREIITETPGHPDAQHLLAILDINKKKFVSALEFVRGAIQVCPDRSEFRNTLGLVQRQLNDHDAAAESFGKALDLDPAAHSIRLNLIDCLHYLGRYPEAAPLCQAIRSVEPKHPQIFLAQGNQHLGENQFEEGIRAFRQCATLFPKFGFGLFRLATAYALNGQSEESIAAFKTAIEAEPRNTKYYYHLTIALINVGCAEEALRVCNSGLAHAAADNRLLSVKIVALERAGETPDTDCLLAWDSLVQSRVVTAPAEFGTLEAFNGALLKHIKAHPSLKTSPAGNATRHGDHSGEILIEPKGPLSVFERVVQGALGDYIEAVGNKSNNSFVRNRPPRLKLTAWSVLMRSGGHQLPHIHPSGWVSGVYYVSIPPAISSDDPSHAGWIEFGQPGPLIRNSDDLSVKLVKPAEGLIVLFPSYLYHRTIPFYDRRRRVCISFDVLSQD